MSAPPAKAVPGSHRSGPSRFESLVDLCNRSCEKFATRPLFGTKGPDGWSWTTYAGFHELVVRCRAGLSNLGVTGGDKVAILSNNCVPWAVCAHATWALGATLVPMYEAQLESERQFILSESGATVVFAANEAIAGRLAAVRANLPALRHVIVFEGARTDPTSYAALLDRTRATAPPSPAPVDERVTANLIYTSGTTGLPKGVLLTHGNVVSNVNALHQIFVFEPEDRSLSFLPWAHAFGQIELHTFMSMGCAMALNRDIACLAEDAAAIQPTILVAVPRVFTRIYCAVREQIQRQPSLVQAILRTAIRSAPVHDGGAPMGIARRLVHGIVDRLVFSKVRQRLGGRIKFAICGSAALGHEVAQFMEAIGLRVYEGYGLTETSPIVSANCPQHRRLGSVGIVIPGSRVVIESPSGTRGEGQIVVYGPNVMQGYYRRPQETEAVLLADGGLRTGDLGYMDDDGFLYVTGRIKDQFKLDNGKYVMPGPLEEALKSSPYIASAFIYGDDRPHCVAIIALDMGRLGAWARKQGFEVRDAATDGRVRALIRDELEERSAGFRHFERIAAFALVTDDFTTESGLITPTLKLKRRVAIDKYRPLLESLYGRLQEQVQSGERAPVE